MILQVFYGHLGITMRYKNSANLITKAWDVLNDTDITIFVVDSVKRLSDDVKNALKRQIK